MLGILGVRSQRSILINRILLPFLVIVAMAVLPSTRSQFLMSGLTLLLILVSYQIRKMVRARRTGAEDATAQTAETTQASPTG